MSTLESRLNDSEYKNWVKAGICLLYTKQGLEDFVANKCKQLHQNVLDNLTKSSVINTGQPVCGVTINRQRLVNICHHPYCQAFLRAVIKEGIDPKYPFTPRYGNLANTNVSLWHSQPYELAKLFMNAGQQPTQSGPAETDLSGIINFLAHCQVPSKQISSVHLIDEVRKARNAIMHTSDFKVTQSDFRMYSQSMINLLIDHNISSSWGAKQALAQIQKVINATDFTILLEDERKVITSLTNELRTMTVVIQQKLAGVEKDVSDVNNAVVRESSDIRREIINHGEEEMRKVRGLYNTLHQRVSASCDLRDQMENQLKKLEELLKETIRENKDIAQRLVHVEQQQTQTNKLVDNLQALQKTYQTQTRQAVADVAQKQTQTNKNIGYIRAQQETYQTQTNESIQNIKTEQEEYHRKTDEVIGDLRDKAGEALIPSEEDKSRLRQYLEEGYKQKLDVTLLPDWEQIHVSEIFTPSILVFEQEKDNQDKEKYRKLGTYKELFYNNGVLQKQVFLLGEAGAGKTTFCKHVTDVWCETTTSTQFADVAVLRQFRYLFYVSCRFAEEKEIMLNMIINQLFDDEKMKEVAIYVLKHHPECCLIVLDGVDEWKGSSTSETGRRGDITGLPSLAGVENCVILITSRPWRFQALSLNTQKIFRRLMINGIKNVQELANRILQQLGDPDPHQSSYEFLDQVEEKNMSELMKIPLILIIALGGWVDDKSFHKSMSINYINMIQSFIRRSKGQAGWSSSESKLRQLIPNLEKQENVWEEISNELPHFLSRYKLFQRYAGLFLSLGQLAFDLLLGTEEQSLVFSKGVLQSYLPADDENDESVNVCLALGILTKTETATRGLKKLESYAFCHKTFQEFFAALWLTSKFSNEKTKLLKCIKNVRDLNSYVILIMFLCGIDPTAGKQFWLDFAEEVEFKGLQAQEVVLKCMKEQTSDQIYFFIPHIYIRGGEEMTLDDIMLLCNVMEEYSDNVKSLNASEYYLELEDLIKVFRSVSSCSGLQSLRLWDVSFFNEESDSIRHHLVLNLQKHNKLEKLKLSEIFVAGLLLPVEGDRITSLDLLYVEMAHHDLKQLGKSLSSCSSLETIKLNKVTCSEHRDRPCSIVLDLHKHDKLEKLKLEYLSVDSLLLPVEGARLTTLKLRNVTMTHHGLKQLEKYLSSSSSLEKMDLDEVTCGEHRDRCCSLVLDLQKHHQLEKLKLGNSSIECLLLSMEGARITSLTLYNLTMTFHGMEQLGEFLSSCSSLETLARITFLSMIDLTMTHHGLKQLGKSLSFCSSLQIVYLSKVTCSEHRDRSCIIDLDLQKHNKLVTLVLRCLSVGSLLLPAGGARITSLELENVTMTHHDLKQLGKSLPSCSSLETIKLNEVTCSEHRDRSCSLVLDLQKHDKLEKLGLGNSSIECVLLPMEGTRIFALYLINVTITHHSLEQMLKYQLNSLNIKLVGVKCYEHRDGSCKPVQDLRERFSRWWK